MVETAELSPEWQRVNEYLRAFTAERVKYALHLDADRMRRLTTAEGEMVLRALEDLMCEAEFIDAVRALPGGVG